MKSTKMQENIPDAIRGAGADPNGLAFLEGSPLLGVARVPIVLIAVASFGMTDLPGVWQVIEMGLEMHGFALFDWFTAKLSTMDGLTMGA